MGDKKQIKDNQIQNLNHRPIGREIDRILVIDQKDTIWWSADRHGFGETRALQVAMKLWSKKLW